MAQRSARLLLKLMLLLSVAITPAFLLTHPAIALNSAIESISILENSAPPPRIPDHQILEDQTLRIDGSDQMSIMNQTLKERFEQQFPDTEVTIDTHGTEAALQALLEGQIDLAAIGRPLSAEERAKGLVEIPISREKIAIIIGRDNSFNGSLTLEQFTRIARGEIRDWSEVGGQPGAIRFIDRSKNSDSHFALSQYGIFDNVFDDGVHRLPIGTIAQSNAEDRDNISEVIRQLGCDGISYAIANQVQGDDRIRFVKVAILQDVLPGDTRYPYSLPRSYAYKVSLAPAVQSFIGFTATQSGQAAIAAAQTAESESLISAITVGAITADSLSTSQPAPVISPRPEISEPEISEPIILEPVTPPSVQKMVDSLEATEAKGAAEQIQQEVRAKGATAKPDLQATVETAQIEAVETPEAAKDDLAETTETLQQEVAETAPALEEGATETLQTSREAHLLEEVPLETAPDQIGTVIKQMPPGKIVLRSAEPPSEPANSVLATEPTPVEPSEIPEVTEPLAAIDPDAIVDEKVNQKSKRLPFWLGLFLPLLLVVWLVRWLLNRRRMTILKKSVKFKPVETQLPVTSTNTRIKPVKSVQVSTPTAPRTTRRRNFAADPVRVTKPAAGQADGMVILPDVDIDTDIDTDTNVSSEINDIDIDTDIDTDIGIETEIDLELEPDTNASADPDTEIDRIDQLYDRSLQYIEAGQYAEALTLLDQVILSRSDAAEIWNHKAQTLVRLGCLEESLVSFDRTIQLNPTLSEVWIQQGKALIDLGRSQEALSSYDQAIQLNADSADAWLGRGNALIWLGRAEEARTSFHRADQLRPNDAMIAQAFSKLLPQRPSQNQSQPEQPQPE